MAEKLYGGKTWPQLVDDTLHSVITLSATKGSEYAGDVDRLNNFRRNGERLGLAMEQVWGVYAGKHWDSIQTFIRDIGEKRQREYSEPLEGRCDDLIVYLILFKAMLAERAVPTTGFKSLCHVCSALTIESVCNGTRADCPYPSMKSHPILSGQTDRT